MIRLDRPEGVGFTPPHTVRRGTYFPILQAVFHDMRLNKDFIVGDPVKQERILASNGKQNEQYIWYFHKFSRGAGARPVGMTRKKRRTGYV